MSKTATKPRFDVAAVRTEASRAFYAGVGVNDLAVAFVRDTVVDATRRTTEKVTGVQKDVEARVAGAQDNVKGIDLAPKALAGQAGGFVNSTVEALTKDAKARRGAIEAKVAELQTELKAYPAKARTFVGDNVDTVVGQYDELVKRGETLVERLRKQDIKVPTQVAKSVVARVKPTKADIAKGETQGKKVAAKVEQKAADTVADAKASAAVTAGDVEKAATQVADKAAEVKTDAAPAKAPAAKPAAKPAATPAAKPAAKKAPAKKAPAKKAPAKPAATKAPAKKAPKAD